MPDEPDESETGDPADGSEEPTESPAADDPERGSPIDPSELDTRDDATGAGETAASDEAEGETEDTPEDESDTGGADDEDSPSAGGRDDPDPGRNADDEDDASEDTSDDDTSDEASDTDVAGDANDEEDPIADDDPDGATVGSTEDAVDSDEGEASDDEADADEVTKEDEGETDEAGADPDDDDAGTDETEERTDTDGPDIDGLDDWPSVKPDPVDIDSGEDDDGEGSSSDEDQEGSSGADDTAESDHDEDDAADEEETEDAALPEAQTDGEGYVRDRPGGGGSAHDDGLGGISTPPDDEEMPLADHIEEMILRLAAVLLVGAVATVIGLLGASWAVEYIWQNVLPADLDAPPHVYHPLELWLTRIKVAALLGILVALPMFVYQCYLFMRPGLYPNERKYYLSAVPMSLVLAVVGMFISFVLVLPILFRYFTFYSEGSAGIAYALGETFNLIITLTGFLAIVFQIPLFIMLAIMMGVTTRKWLVDKRLYFWAAFFGLSFMFTMDPTLMAPIIVGIIMIVLFEGTLLLLKWTGQE